MEIFGKRFDKYKFMRSISEKIYEQMMEIIRYIYNKSQTTPTGDLVVPADVVVEIHKYAFMTHSGLTGSEKSRFQKITFGKLGMDVKYVTEFNHNNSITKMLNEHLDISIPNGDYKLLIIQEKKS
jgi:hypothetical protein